MTGASTSGNLSSDPLFVSTSTPDYHLQSGSPAINAGVSTGATRDYANHAIAGNPDIGAYEYVTIGPAPSAPTLNSPVNGATGVGLSPILSWSTSSGATSFNVHLSSSATMSPLIVNATGVTSTGYGVSGLANAITYYWQVSATNGNGTGPWSSVSHFTTGVFILPEAEAPTLFSPVDGDTGVSFPVSLTWIAGLHATSYEIQVATSSGMSPTIVDVSGITSDSTEYSSSVLIAGTTYYWRARSFNASSVSEWTAVRSFRMTSTSPIGTPVLSSPPDESTVSTFPIVFSWGSVPYATTYRIQISANSGLSSLVLDNSTTGRTISTNVLSAGNTYYWRVLATNGVNTSLWSSSRSLTIATTIQQPTTTMYLLKR